MEPTSPEPITLDSGEPYQYSGSTSSAADAKMTDWTDTTGAPQPGRNILAGDPVTASAPVPRQLVAAIAETCSHCGTVVVPSISDLLRESAGWVTDMDAVIVAFYSRMMEIVRDDSERSARMRGADPFTAAQEGNEAVADLAHIFPADLISATAGEGNSRGVHQRDKLASALVDLAKLFDPSDEEKMRRLDSAVSSMGGRHASFVRRDGTVQGATLEEYAIAKRALMDVLGTLGDRFTDHHREAWSLAYDFVAGGMMRVQQLSGFSMPRFPRV